ncbi:hypothetical protein LTR53_013695 [Teratosphaeriaceae sp. CCFEE 6253]|nr:hypothetical protein LTR53_013695 [Teratosphaeriaceae sp. CCFEE 6253]
MPSIKNTLISLLLIGLTAYLQSLLSPPSGPGTCAHLTSLELLATSAVRLGSTGHAAAAAQMESLSRQEFGELAWGWAVLKAGFAAQKAHMQELLRAMMDGAD